MTALADARSRAVSVPASVWLVGLVVVSAAVRIALAHGIAAPWIMVDELVYSELASSVAAHGHLLVRDRPANGYGIVYPLLIAPAWRAFAARPDAYEAAKALNAVAMSLTAVPAYLLARRLLAPGYALVAALLTVLVPSMLYTGELMTENAFYPLFVLVALALVLVLEQPTAVRQAAVVGLCLLAIATRVQGVALLPAAALAPLFFAFGEPLGLRTLRRFTLLYALLAALVAAALGVTVARGRSPLALLGAYRAAAHGTYTVGSVLRSLVFHVAELDLYLGVVPTAALLALWLTGRSASPRVRAFAAASCALVVCLVVEVAIFASQPSIARVQERNVFYVAPLALIALFAFAGSADRTLPRGWPAAVALAAGVLPVLVPYARLFDGAAVSDTLAILPWWWAHERGLPLGGIRWIALAVSLGAAGAFLALPRPQILALAAAVGVYYVGVSALAFAGRNGMRSASVAALAAGVGDVDRNWIDRAVGPDATVVVVRSDAARTYAVWESELFNRSVGSVYDLGGRLPGGLAETPVLRRADGSLVAGGGPLRARYVLVDGAVDLGGTQIAAASGPGLRLLRVDGQLALLGTLRGIYAGDTWSGRNIVYTRLRCGGGRLEVVLESDPKLFRRDQIVTAAVGGRSVGRAVVPPSGRRLLVVPLRPDRAKRCRANFRVARTVVPAQAVQGSSDERALGVHFVRVTYHDA